jgi:two-component system response regulator NreC
VQPIKILIADDHTILRKGLCALLEKETDLKVVGESEDGRETIAKVEQLRPDVVVLDISMPVLNGIEATRQIKKRFPETQVLGLSIHDNEESVFQTLRAGASGYLIKKSVPEELISAIKAVHRGESYLSPAISKTVIEHYIRAAEKTLEEDPFETLTDREREVLQLIAEGGSNREIADLLYLSIKTVQTHKTHIMEKLNLHSMADLIRYALRKGVIPDQPDAQGN